MKRGLKICFVGGSQAGVIGALTLLSQHHCIISSVSYFEELTRLLKRLKVPVYSSINSKDFLRALNDSDVLISIHGREIVKSEQLAMPRIGCFNAHPYLYKYKGADPVGRALKEKNFKASVGIHEMGPKADEGKVLVEEFLDVSGANTVEEIYNRLYPCYSLVLLKALAIILAKKRLSK